MTDPTALVQKILGGVKAYVERSLTPFLVRLKAVEDRPAPAKGDVGDKGDRGEDGRSVEIAEVKALVDSAVAAIPAPKDGTKGEDGKDADPVVIKQSVAEALAALPTPKDGRDGKDADPEVTRALIANAVAAIQKPKDGNDGKDADPAIIERMVKDAVSKMPPPADGKDADPAAIAALVAKAVAEIAKPADGHDGEDGRDAMQVDVLEGIDPAKQYKRNTYAAFRGGIVRSFKGTDPLPADGDLERAGWHVMVRGIDEAAIELGADERSIGFALRMTDGGIVLKTLKTRFLIDREVYKDDSDYEAGDVVTWGGCLWTARKDAVAGVRPGIPKGTPGYEESISCWRLSVKAGRDGRDGVRGEKGDRGAEGRAGRDIVQKGPGL